MDALSPAAQKTYSRLVDLLGTSNKICIDNNHGRHSPIVVERLSSAKLRVTFGQHSYTYAMSFWTSPEGRVYPISIDGDTNMPRAAGLAVAFSQHEKIACRPLLQRGLTSFAEIWLNFIDRQQSL